MTVTRLDRYNNDWYKPGRNRAVLFCWYFINVLFFINPLNPSSSLKIFLLKMFGARIGTGVRIKPAVNIKYPWKLTLGDYVWVGEHVWIDNLEVISIGNHACLSQGAMLLTGNHDYKKEDFGLITESITIEQGVWIGAHAIVCPGVTCKSHSVLAVNSVATHHLDANTIYQGNPAVAIRKREIKPVS
ncbi:MAG: colanic acid biosynthesis acetyltransferase WcaF [Bacteroidetes bacterium]|nr:colanic acid biosynthesis acetyltransferase WcaF [Bacteroidota bacterium]